MPNNGIQASGICEELNHDNLQFIEYKKLYLERFTHSNKLFDSHYIYKIKLEKIVLFDEINYPDEPCQTYNLN